MKYLFLILFIGAFNRAFSLDSTKSNVCCKIMNGNMLPVSSGSNITNNSDFNKFITRYKIKSIVKSHSSKYDSIGEFKYMYTFSHDTNAYILADSLKKIIGIKEVYVAWFILANRHDENIEFLRIYPNPAANSLFIS